MSKKTSYVVGFMFSQDGERVLLIQKTKPNWQAGKLNGVGGHINDLEQPYEAMIREFKEETGIDTVAEDWKRYAILESDYAIVHFYSAFNNKMNGAIQQTEEKPIVRHCNSLHKYPVIKNLLWLVPMALDNQHIFTQSNFTLESNG